MSAEPRHAVPPLRRRRSRRGILIASGAVALLTGTTAGFQVVGASGACDPNRTVLEVVVSPDIALPVSRVAETLRDPAGCPAVSVQAETEADTLPDLAWGRTPDVWIPASSMWVARVGSAITPTQQQSIASSPLVIAVPRAVRNSLAGEGGVLDWNTLVAATASGEAVLAAPAATTSPATIGLLLALEEAVDRGPSGRADLTGLLQMLRVGPAPVGDAAASQDAAVPVSEQSVWAANGATPHASDGGPDPVAVYPPGAGAPFDYPFVDLSTGERATALAGRLLAALRDDDGRRRLREAGFRDEDGVGSGLTADRGVDGNQPPTINVPDLGRANDVVRTLEAVRQNARLLAVVDVSGSMAAPVPEAGGRTRLDLALRAAAAGLAFYPDSTKVGFWTFSEALDGTTDHRELLPMTRLTGTSPSGREQLAGLLGRVQPVPAGGTGLYDTTLAAVRSVREGWEANRINAVVLLTDGEDTDEDGIGLDQLLATLRAEQADGRVVPVITIAYGEDSGAQALAAISEATGGTSYQTMDPDDIREIFLDAVGQRACRPHCVPSTDD